MPDRTQAVHLTKQLQLIQTRHSCLIHPTCNCLICPTCNVLFPVSQKEPSCLLLLPPLLALPYKFSGPKNSCPSTSTKLWGLMISRWTPASNTSFHLYHRTRFLDFLPFLISFLFLFPTKFLNLPNDHDLLSLIASTILLVQYEM